VASAIAVLVLLVYVPAYNATWSWDDDVSVYSNPLVREPDGLRRIWLTTEDHDFWPLTRTAFRAEYAAFGDDPQGYHVVNVILHALTAMLVYLVLLRLQVPGAGVAALLFALHPVNAATTVWISQLKSLIATGLLAVTALAWLGYKRDGRPSWYLAALAAYIAALTAKTTVVTWPVMMLGLAWWRGGRITRRDLAESAPFFAVAAAMTALTILVQGRMDNPMMQPLVGAAKLAGAGWVFWFYVSKVIWPVGLSAIYPHWKQTIALWGWMAYVPTLALVGMVVISWLKRQSPWWRGLLVATAYAVLAMAPVMGVFGGTFTMHSLVGDHYQYLPSIGVVAAVCAAGATAVRRWPRARVFAVTAAAVVAVLLGSATVVRARVWATQEALWTDTLAKNPDAWVAHYNLATSITGKLPGKAEGLLAATQDAQRLDAEAGSRAVGGDHAAAAASARAAEDRRRDQAAIMDEIRGLSSEAIDHYRRSLALQPLHVRTYINLGVTLAGLGQLDQIDEAIAVYREGLEIESRYFPTKRDPTLPIDFGKALIARQRFGEAVSVSRAALRLKPDDPVAKSNLVDALTGLAWVRATSAEPADRNSAEALDAIAEVQRLVPLPTVAALDVEAAVLADAGRYPEAAAVAQKALDMARRRDVRATAALVARMQLYSAGQPYRAGK